MCEYEFDAILYAFFLSDSDSEVEELQSILGPEVPVYGSPRTGYTALELVSMILKEDQKLCTLKPTGVRTFASFIVDLKCISLKDLAADNNGVWVTLIPRCKYELKQKNGEVHALRHIPKVTPEIGKHNVITLCRQYGTHQATPEF